MSYAYDVLTKAWGRLREQLPKEVQGSELEVRFGFLLEDMHEANHKLRDAINKDGQVTRQARKLDAAMSSTPDMPE